MKVTLNCVTNPLVETVVGGDRYVLSPEEYMIYCARVSSTDNRANHETAPKLLKYLIDHKHWSPFEMIAIGFEIETSRAIAQQILRHRSFSFQEFSQRYAEVNEFEPVELRLQAATNRQSSTTILPFEHDAYEGVREHIEACHDLYQQLLEDGVAKECARMVLPLATQTTIVMHGTLRSWIHFLEQRCSEHAQKEIRLIANAIKAQLTTVVPWTASALNWEIQS